MTDRKQKETASRREFFKSVGLGAGAAGALVVAGGGEAEAEIVREDGSLGYRETDHVKRVYQLARF
jgi:hypothetical protein